MGRENSGQGRLRCRPGDLARVIRSHDESLIDRRVLVLSACSEKEWVVLLLGAPTQGWTTQGDWCQTARQVIFYDASLEPIERSNIPAVSLCAEGSEAQRGHRTMQTDLSALTGH